MAYLFQSERLGFRSWRVDDVAKMAAINADPAVMEFFPKTKTRKQTAAFIEQVKSEFSTKGFCYFAIDKLDNGEFIGFIGLSEQRFEADFTPCIEIGWRLARKEWGRGYATEGAARCLEYAFDELNLRKVVAMTPEINLRSEKVMKKIGMEQVKRFRHPLLKNEPRLANCVLYEAVAKN